MTRVAIVGTGSIAEAHIDALREQGDRIQVVAAGDVVPDRLRAFCDRHGIPGRYTDLAGLLKAERPDLVHICTPPSAHAALAIQCLHAGATVFCEKPVCGSLAELDRIETAERASGRFCVTVAQWRFGSGARHLKRLAQRGVLGRPLVGLCQTTWYRDASYYAVPWRRSWEEALGGATMAQGIHAIDLFLWELGDDWTELDAVAATVDRDIAVEDVSMAIIHFADGALGNVVNSVLGPHEETRLRFDFQRATVEVACLYQYRNKDWLVTPAPGAEREVTSAWAAIPDDIPNTHSAQLVEVLDSLELGARPTATAGEMRPTLELISSLYQSAATRERVRRGSIRPGDPFYERVFGSLVAQGQHR